MYYTKESALHIPALEARLSANVHSPMFARLASYYLMEGKTQQALDLCLRGTKRYPHYPAGQLMLGKAYESLGRYIEAMLAYRKAFRALPDNPEVEGLLKRAEQREQEAFQAFSEERAHKLRDREGTFTMETFVEQAVLTRPTVDMLIQRLRETRTSEEMESAPTDAQRGEGGSHTIVTATLAEIYASQGEYRAALEAYKKLREQHPSEADRYDKRMVELEEAIRSRQTVEQKV